MPAILVDLDSISRRLAGPTRREPKTTRALAILASLELVGGDFGEAGLIRVAEVVWERG